MKLVHKFGSLLLAGMMLLSMAACGQSSNTTAEASSNTAPAQASGSGVQQAETAKDTAGSAAAEETTSAGSKVLVVYYSASGNTKRAAESIAEASGADLFEITPAQPYSSEDLDWTNEDSRVSREHSDESLRDVELTTTEVPNWEDYDTVFIGYPIWWG